MYTSFMTYESRNLDPQLGEILECGKYYGLIPRVMAAWWCTQFGGHNAQPSLIEDQLPPNNSLAPENRLFPLQGAIALNSKGFSNMSPSDVQEQSKTWLLCTARILFSRRTACFALYINEME